MATRPALAPVLRQSSRAKGFAYLGLAAVIFIGCSIVQALGGSHMFTRSYQAPDSVLLAVLLQVTWWPGWLATVFFGLRGALLVATDRGDG